MSDLSIIRNFCNNNINDLDKLSSEAKKILIRQSLKVLNDQNNFNIKKAVEILNILTNNNFCIFKYRLDKINNELISTIDLTVENNYISYNMKIYDKYKQYYDLYSHLFHLYKIKELPNLNEHKDFCKIDYDQLILYGKRYYHSRFTKWINLLISTEQFIVIVSNINNNLIRITADNFTDEHLFQLFYYYFVCIYNNFSLISPLLLIHI